MGEAGRHRLEESFGIDRLVEETAALYRELLARRGGAASVSGEIGRHGGGRS